ncbi:AMP-binding protein [Hyphomonas sp.]|uniref:AMP-binding protein n=1 Tax=Hyphomonas sp. TaxID=87 RepID=UPI0030FB220A
MSAVSKFAPVPFTDQPVRQFYNPEAASFHSDIGNYVPRRIETLMEEAAGRFGKEPFLTTALPNGASATLSYSDVEKHSANLARYLRDELKLEKGAVVAIQSPNCISNVLAMLAVLRAGLVLTNINPLYTAYETRRQLRDAKAVVLITSSLFPDATEEALQGTHVGTVITLSLTDFFSPVKKATMDFVLQHVKKMGRPLKIANVPMCEALKRGAKHATPVATYAPDRDADEDAIYQYSGGTTGVSKGVRLTEAGVVTNVEQFASLSPHMIDAPGQTMLLVLPVYHVFGMFSSIIALRNAAHLVLVPSPKPLSNLKAAFRKFRPNAFPGVSTLFAKLMDEKWFYENPPQLTLTISGAMALSPAVRKEWTGLTGSSVIEGYGMTETTTLISINPPDARTRIGSVGLPLPGTGVSILRDDGSFASPGETGEIAVAGPQVMAGYLGRPETTSATFHDDWMKTGDVGYLDDDGFLYLVDRLKDMLLVGGFNVFPNEVDAVLAEHPGIAEAAVAGVSDGNAGDTMHAFVVRRDPELTAAEVQAHCAGFLTGYKRPRAVHFVDELPKSPIGKVVRRELRARVSSGELD